MNDQTIEQQTEEVSFSDTCDVFDEALEAAGGTIGVGAPTGHRWSWQCP